MCQRFIASEGPTNANHEKVHTAIKEVSYFKDTANSIHCTETQLIFNMAIPDNFCGYLYSELSSATHKLPLSFSLRAGKTLIGCKRQKKRRFPSGPLRVILDTEATLMPGAFGVPPLQSEIPQTVNYHLKLSLSQPGLEFLLLTTPPSPHPTPASPLPCLYLPNGGIAGMSHYAQLLWCHFYNSNKNPKCFIGFYPTSDVSMCCGGHCTPATTAAPPSSLSCVNDRVSLCSPGQLELPVQA